MARTLLVDFWDTSTPGLGSAYSSGWYPGRYDDNTTLNAAPSRLYATIPIVTAQHTMTILTAAVRSNANSINARIGCYEADSNGLPSALVYDSGDVSIQNSTHTVTPNTLLKPRTLYWLATLCNSQWSVFARGAQMPEFLGVGSGREVSCIITTSYGYGALPSTFPTAAMSATVTGPEVVVRIV